MASSSPSRAWGFQTLLVASGASELETTASSGAVQLVASEPQLACWSRAVSYRVVTRADVEAQARATKREELDAAARTSAEVEATAAAMAAAAAAALAGESPNKCLNGTSDNSDREQADGQSLPEPHAEVSTLSASDSSTSARISPSPSTVELIASMEMTPQILANALQWLVLDDKAAFLAHTAALAASSGAGGTKTSEHDAVAAASAASDSSAVSSSTNASSNNILADFAADHQPESQGDGAAPARIYLLHQYPSSLAEILALLRTGEAHSARQGDLPLLPLIDGVVLVVDPSKELREGRRRSIGLADERRKSTPQRQILATAAASATRNSSVNNDDTISAVAAVAPVFQTASELVRECFDASSVGGLEWSDFVFADVTCSAAAKEPRGLAELAKELLLSAEALAAHKYAFKRWVSTTTMIPIAAFDAASATARAMLQTYERIVDGVYEASVGVSTVLFAMREAVALAADTASGSAADVLPASDDDWSSNQSYVEEFITHSDNVALRLAIAYATFISEQTMAQSLRGANDRNSGGSGDGIVGGYSVADPCSVLGRRIDEIEKEMWAFSDLPGTGNRGRKGMPIQPTLAHTVRSTQDTELRAFSPFDVARVHLTRQLLQFEDLLGASWKGKLQPARRFLQELDRAVLPQRLAQILGNFPVVYKHYDDATDSLLLATLAATAPGRFRTTTWSARDCVRHRPAFKDWKRERLVPDEYLTPRTLKALGACVPLSSAELAQLSEKTSVLFPSDQSVIRVYQTPRGDAWLSVYQGGDVFGFRQIDAQRRAQHASLEPTTAAPSAPLPRAHHRLEFCASFADASQLHIREGRTQRNKPDGFSTVSVDNTFPNGLTVTACSDGSIVQRYVSAARRAATVSSGPHNIEVFRLIVGKGTVVRAFASAKRTALLANGDVYHFTHRGAPSDEESLTGKALRIVDPATNALVETRANGVVVITHTDGARATYHADGTCMFTTATRSHVLVTKAGFADVCVDVAVNAVAQRHARGERVAVTKGGLRTRSTVEVYDGTRIAVSYNTKVIAQVNGRVSVRKPSGVHVVAKDSGRIEYDSRATAAAVPCASAEDADLDVTNHNGVYYFDCARGRFELCDDEQNQFSVDFGANNNSSRSSVVGEVSTAPPPHVVIDLAGVVSDADATKYGVAPIPAKALVNDPIEPHLLVLRGDGTGAELLRTRDIEQYLRECTGAEGRRREMFCGGGQQHQRVFFEALECACADGGRGAPRRVLFDDSKLDAEMARLARPVNAAAVHLAHIYFAAQLPRPQFTIVRRLEQLEPLSAAELEQMHAALAQWRAWQDAREATKEQYRVEDPRDADAIAQQAVVQRKVVAAYKAARVRKKLERQRAREATRKLQQSQSSHGAAAKMETVQEGDEQPHGDDGGLSDNDEDDDAFACSSGDDSGENGNDLGDDVDDPNELLWTAFAAADTASAGRLSIAQTRHALVHALGAGVQTAELLEALERLKLQDPSQVGFDTFAELVSEFKRCSESSNTSTSTSTSVAVPVPALVGWRGGAPTAATQQPETIDSDSAALQRVLVAAGSATEAIRLKARTLLPRVHGE